MALSEPSFFFFLVTSVWITTIAGCFYARIGGRMTLQNMCLSHISEHPWHLGHRRCPETCRQPPRWRGATVAFFCWFHGPRRGLDCCERPCPDVARFLQRLAPVWVAPDRWNNDPREHESTTRVAGSRDNNWAKGEGHLPPPPLVKPTTPARSACCFQTGFSFPCAMTRLLSQTGNDDSCRFKSVVCTAALRADEILDGLSHDGSSTRRPS